MRAVEAGQIVGQLLVALLCWRLVAIQRTPCSGCSFLTESRTCHGFARQVLLTRRVGWGLVALAASLMVARRVTAAWVLVTGRHSAVDLVALPAAITFTMLAGVALLLTSERRLRCSP